jgi:dienelactone hydrolase
MYMSTFFRSSVVLALLGLSPLMLRSEDAPPEMHVMHTPGKTRFGLFGKRPVAPAPTLFVLAGGVDDMGKQPIYSETGRHLAKHGWLYVTVDIPCHGNDRRSGEPDGLPGWAHRIKAGQDLISPFTKRCTEVLDFLVAEGYTDPKQVAACGTSRGGFCALHLAAAEPRVRAVTCISPVTDLLVLREFAGLKPQQFETLNVVSLADKLAGRAIWLSIGNHDERVGTDECIAAARRLVAEMRRRHPDIKTVPVELVVSPADGHHAIDNAYGLAADFVRKQTAQ